MRPFLLTRSLVDKDVSSQGAAPSGMTTKNATADRHLLLKNVRPMRAYEANRPRGRTATGRRGTTRSAIAGVVYTTTFSSFPLCFRREPVYAFLQ